MSYATPAVQTRAAQPISQMFQSAARPRFGTLFSLLIIFKPLAVGIVRAVLTALNPRLPLAERQNRQRLRDTIMLNRMAREVAYFEPGMADELRSLAGRD